MPATVASAPVSGITFDFFGLSKKFSPIVTGSFGNELTVVAEMVMAFETDSSFP